ncbi:hypothetical protein D3C71_1768360 [compost metagenome]
MAGSRATASAVRAPHWTAMSASSRILGANSRISYKVTTLAVFCIWSMVSSSELVRPRISERSNGVMKLRRTANRTSRATSSASCS